MITSLRGLVCYLEQRNHLIYQNFQMSEEHQHLHLLRENARQSRKSIH